MARQLRSSCRWMDFQKNMKTSKKNPSKDRGIPGCIWNRWLLSTRDWRVRTAWCLLRTIASSLRARALRVAKDYVVTTHIITLYGIIHRLLQDTAFETNRLPDAVTGMVHCIPELDASQMETTAKKAACELEKLHINLKNYRNNSAIENIRQRHVDIRSHYLDCSDLTNVKRRACNYFSTPKHMHNIYNSKSAYSLKMLANIKENLLLDINLAVPCSVPNLRYLHSSRPPTLCNQSALQLLVHKTNNRGRRSRSEILISKSSKTRPLSKDSLYLLLPMEKEDLPAVTAFMKREGWNVDFDNLAAVFEMQPEAYFVAVTLNGDVVGMVSGNRLDDSVGVLSYVLVNSHHWRRGLGKRLTQICAEALATPTVVAFSTEDAISFHKSNNYKTRFRVLVGNFYLDAKDFSSVPDNTKIHVVPAQKVDFEKLNQYDSAVHGIERAEYLANWIIRKDKVAFAAVDSESGEVVGYIALSYRPGRWDIVPLYANSEEIALQLLKKTSQQIGEPARVFVRIPADFKGSIKLFSTMRDIQHKRVLYFMSTQPFPTLKSGKVYSLSTASYGLK